MELKRRIRTGPRSGQSMVEFAASFFLLMMLFFGIFELGRTMWSYTTISYATRQAARYAMVRSSLSASTDVPHPIDTVVYKNAPGLSKSLMTITKSWTPDAKKGSQFTITVKYPVTFIAYQFFLPDNTKNQVTVSSTATYTILN